jgi:hypothetical protein
MSCIQKYIFEADNLLRLIFHKKHVKQTLHMFDKLDRISAWLCCGGDIWRLRRSPVNCRSFSSWSLSSGSMLLVWHLLQLSISAALLGQLQLSCRD